MNLGGRFFDGDSNAARGAIIDALLSSRTRGDFKEQDATAEEEHYIEAAEQQREQWYYENYHMTYEEYLQYREIVLPELLRKYANFAPDILYPQFVASFEDAYAAEHSQTNNTENNEQQRNDTTAEEPTTTPGDTVLQTEETNNSRGDSQSEEQPTEVPTGVRSSNENGTLPQSTPTEVDKEPQPIGNSFFGKVYNQFKGKAKEAVNFLMRHKSGKLLGVFHRNDIGEISLVWGDEKGGLAHIISKHIVEQNDFNNIDEVINTMQQVINNGTITRENKDKVVIDYNDYRVAIRKQTRDNNGNVVEQGNWIVTAFDKSRSKKDKTPSEKTLSTPPSNQETDGVTLPSNGVPADKVTQSSQTKETKEDKFSPTPRKDGESITDYAERVAEEHQAQRTRKEEEAKVDTNPTDAQKEAGNYKKGHIKVDGLNITIEQPKGSIRRGTDANGKQWESEMHNTYGYIRGTESVDGDHIDIFLSDNPTEGKVFVVDQVNKDGSFDEHKVMYGFPDMESAKQAYLSNYEEGWQGLGNITEVSKEDFKAWIDSSKRKTKPFAEYTSVKKQDDTQTKKPTEENAAPANTETNENYAHNSEEIMHEQKNVQLQQAINAYENATKFYYQQLKEGKLDKVFESKQWKDVLRKQTELQKVLLQLNSEELKELLKQTTNEDTKKEIKGALDAVLRQEQRSIEYNAVLDKQEPITPIYKEEKKPIAVTEFVETDKKEAEIHPVLTGVYHDNGYVVGTNAHILLVRKEDYNKSLEGKISNKKGEVIDGKYPNWRAVVEGETTTNSWGINLDELHAFVRGVLAKLKADGAKKSSIDSATIAFKDTDGKIIVCNAKTLDKALRGAKSIGATEFGNKSKTFAHAQTKKGYVVCPTISTYHSINDNCFVYAPKEAARQQTTATLTNDTEAKQKATEAVLAALSKAGIEVVQATDEQAQAMLANEIGAEKQVVYHGSRAKFKNFDHSHMGEGEGQQAYGWGSYVTEVESIGRTYATGNGKIKFRGFVLEAMHSLEVKEHFSGAERKVLNFLHKWIKRSNNVSTAIEKVKEWASNEYEKYSGRRNWSDQDYKDYFGAISKRDVREWRKEMEEKEENAQQMLSFIETLSVDDFSLPQGHLYTVDIPDDTGSNYLNWEQPISDEQLDAIEEYLKENYRASRVKIFTDGIAKSNSSNAQEVDAFTRQGKNIYHLLEHTIGDDKSVSEMLGSLGYTGISYPAQYQSGGRADNARNYVIFNEKDLKITDHIQFMRTPQGTIYGWSVNGKIYLTEAGLNPETPIHEYTHLWADAMMKQNKQGWNSIKSLLKDTLVWKEVIADPNYSNIKDNEDAVASEVLSRISGKKNAAKMEEEAQRAIDEAKGVFEKAEAATVFLNLKRALKQFWHWVGKNVFGIKDFKNIDEVTDRVLYDLLSNTKLTEEDNEEIAKRDKLYLDAVERGDMETAQRMVNEAAAQNGYVPNSEYQGSSAFNGAAPYGNGYFLTKEERKGAYENDEFDGDTSLDDYVNSGIDPMNLDYLTNDSSYRHADDARKEAIENLRNVFQNKRQTITMYRSVPSSIKEGSFRNGDWVTPSYAYAVENARVHGWGNNYRIIEQKVPIADVWFDGNDIAEFGYGNENDFTNDKDYLYSNTKNNRKLPDAVTYDDKGNVIPLSKRFNKAKSDPRFQIVGNSLSDEEKKIVETAKANDTYMKAPNGKPTNLSEKQWAQVRTKAFKKWFGDWEKAARIEKLRRSKAVKITEADYEDKYDLTRNSAKQWAKDNIRGEYMIVDTGEKVNVSKVSINEVLSHGERDAAHLKSISSIGKLLHNAIFITETPNAKDNDKYESYRYYIEGVKIDGEDYTAKIVVGVKNGKTYYDHRLTKIEKGSLLDSLNGLSNSVAEKQQTSFTGKDSKLLSILQTNSSKVVDENGEPMVGYHGTLADGLRQFSTDFIGSRYSYDEKGFFFISNRKIADDYAVSEFDASRRGEVIDAYVSLRNPLVVNSEWCKKNGLGSNVFKDNDVIEFWDNYQSLMIEESERNDGVIITDGETSMVVAFFPNQIKSATGNNGNFSTTEDDILYRTVFGGNSGYVGYSMSKRAAEAKEEGRYPKTEFKREYHITAKSLDMLTSLGFINNSEWHHTSMYGNKTPFYGWAEDELADDYLKHKKEVDTLCKGIDPKTKQPLLEKVEKPQYEHEYEMPQYGEAETAANPIREWRHKQIEKYDQFTGFKGYADATEEEKKERDAYLHSLNEQMEEKIREMLAKDYPDYLAAKNALDAYNNYEEDLRKAIGEHIKEYLDIDKYSQRWREQTATTQPTTNTEELTNHAESVVQNLHLNNVEIVPDGSSLNGEQATAKGFYNKRTGKIVVVAGNHTDIADIEKTVLHEAVAHHGLRELFGDNFDNFLDTVFAKADIETRRQIAHLSAKHGWNIRTATEEYLASMAEDTNFEQIKPTLWQRIKQLFGEIMSALGLHHANITDNDLRYILWRSYKNLQGGGRRSILDKAEDIAMQYRLKAGNYADKFTNELNAVNERFNEELSNLTEENADKVTLWLGKPSKVLLAAGVEDKPMKLYGNKVIRKMKKHSFSLEELRDLPRAVADPVAVFNNYQREGNRSILTELKTQQGNFLVSVNIGKDADINFNIVRSVFGKGNENVVAWINNGLATYINKEKALSFLSHQSAPIAATAANAGQESSSYLHLSAPIAEAAENSELSSAAKIIKDFHNPKLNSNVLYRSSIDPTATEVLPDARTRYEKETKEPDNIDSVPKTHNFFRRFYKSYVDSMLALKSFTSSVLEATGDKMSSHEDTYKAENAMTSKNKTDGEVYNPLFPYMPLYLYM